MPTARLKRSKKAERDSALLQLTKESDVAEAVWRAVNDTTGQLRFPAGADAVALAQQAAG